MTSGSSQSAMPHLKVLPMGWIPKNSLRRLFKKDDCVQAMTEVRSPLPGPDSDTGYLSASKGQTFIVLYVGSSGDEEEWVFAKRATGAQPPPQGWLPKRSLMRHLPDERNQLFKKGDCVQAMTDDRDELPESETGYLSTTKGETFVVLYVGSSGDEEEYVFAERNGDAEVDATQAQKVEKPSPVGPPPTRPAPSEQPPARPSPVQPPPPVVLAARPPPPAKPALPALTLKLVTFGLETCGDSHLEKGCEAQRGGGNRASFSDDELRQALQRKGEPSVDIIVDARRFRDPHAERETRHIGVNPTIISEMVHHRNFKAVLLEIKQQWRDCKNAGATDLVVAVYCRSGKHRSVALAECLKHVAQKLEKMCVHQMKHLSKERWGSRICTGWCTDCSQDPHQVRAHAFDLVLEYWGGPLIDESVR